MSTPAPPMTTLFEKEAPHPLADRLRPQRLADIVGQHHLLGPEGPIGRMVASRQLASMILWGPPGCGKTTIERLLAQELSKSGTDLAFEPLSAVFSGVADLRKVFEAAKKRRAMGQGTLLFVDEIHRFNRAQQDAFLPYVEDGTVILVGATTENPSFELIGALLSRAQVFVLRRLSDDDLETLLRRAEQHLGHASSASDARAMPTGEATLRRKALPLTEDGRAALRAMANCDGRFLFNLVEEIARLPAGNPLGPRELARVVQQRAPVYDKGQEGHYNLISALHKSLRGSDTDAALYWLARMLAGGEDPIYILRRLTRAAVEDIGLADPQAVVQALAAWDTYARLAGRRAGDRPMRDLSRHRAEIERCLHSVWRSPPDGARDRFADAADAHPQRADAADARPRLRQGLCLRPRHRGRLLRPELFPGRGHEAQLLSARRARLRARGQKAPRLLGQAASARGDIGMTNSSRPVLRRTCGLAALVRI